MNQLAAAYCGRIAAATSDFDWSPVSQLAAQLLTAWQEGRRVFVCGNGGSAANAQHFATDFSHCLVEKLHGHGIRCISLTVNTSVMTCLANDAGYEHVFAEQLEDLASPGDLLIALSGSGNSPNVVRALEKAKTLRVGTAAILGFSGGRCKDLADLVIHFRLSDMQVVEDLQMMVGHMIMQWLAAHPDRPTQAGRA